MKRIIILILTAIFAAFPIVGCNSNDDRSKKQEIILPNEIAITTSGVKLPDIALDDTPTDKTRFSFDNEDRLVYVFNGRIYLAEGASKEFTTTLNVTLKADPTISKTVSVVKTATEATTVTLACDTEVVNPGGQIEFSIKTSPKNAFIGDVTYSFDKPEYVIIGEDEFTLSSDVPFGEEITAKITTAEGLESECAFKVVEQVYEIYSTAQLKRIANRPSGCFKLMKDLDFSGEKFTPVKTFSGLFDGNGHSIKNITLSDVNKAQIAFLAEENRGTIKNVTFSDCKVNGASIRLTMDPGEKVTTSITVGAACAINYGTVENVLTKNCSFSAMTLGSLSDDYRNSIIFGGIAGTNEGVVTRCGSTDNYAEASLYTMYNTLNATFGGICGYNGKTIEDCYSYDNTLITRNFGLHVPREKTSRLYNQVGGVVGQSYGDVRRAICGNNKIDAANEGCTDEYNRFYCGIFVGEWKYGKIEDSYCLRAVGEKANPYSDGISFINKPVLSNCKAFDGKIWKNDPANNRLIIRHDRS